MNDGRTPLDRRTPEHEYAIRSPMSLRQGSGELKNNVYPCKSISLYIKVEFEGSKDCRLGLNVIFKLVS